jgi:hypothetical protein
MHWLTAVLSHQKQGIRWREHFHIANLKIVSQL